MMGTALADLAPGRDIEVLDTSPRLGGAFARSLVPRRAHRPPSIPHHAAVIPDLRQDAARLAAYAHLTGFTLRDHVPATWLHVLTFPLHIHLLAHPASSIRLVGAVHVSNRMTLRRPVGSTERLSAEVHLDALRPHRKGALVDLIGTLRSGDDVVWEGVSTYLAQGILVPGEPAERERLPFEGGAPHQLWRLPGDLGRRYRAVSGDPNPIHTSRLAARAFGFPRPLMHGMWTHARALAALEGRLDGAYTASVEFTKPVLLPSTVGLLWLPATSGPRAAVTSRDGSSPHLVMSVASASLDQ